MSTIADVIEFPAPELLDRRRDGRFEFIDGQLVERPTMGAEAVQVATLLVTQLQNHATANALGLVFSSDCGYQIFKDDPRRVRFPDGSFIRYGRLPGDKAPRGHVRISPDLAFEVVSPNDNAEDVDNRLTDLLGAGARLIWVLYPASRHVMVFRQGPDCARLSASDALGGEDVMPGFTCKIADLFPKS